MNNFLNQLNLTAQERRIVAVIFLVVIVVLNYLFVWPRFSDWGSLNRQLDQMRDKIKSDNAVIKQDWDPAHPTNGWKMQVEELTKREGGSVLLHPVDPQVQLQNTIRTQERKTGVFVQSINPGSVKTNEFFEEQSTAISLECQEPQLVNFLYNMGMDPAMIRVAMLNLKPADGNRYRLKAGLTLTANYTKVQPAAVSQPAVEKRASAPKPVAGAGSKPAGAPGAKTPAAKGPPGINRSPSAGQRPFVPARPVPSPKPAPGQRTRE